MQETWAEDLTILLDALPKHIVNAINDLVIETGILEIVMDLGRVPEARFPNNQ